MKRFSRPMMGVCSAALGGLVIFAALQFGHARETNAPPHFNVQDSPINRESRLVTSYAAVVKRAAPSVVNIYSTRTVHEHPMMNPFSNDPFFRRFFGPDFNQQGRSRALREESLGSGVIVSPNGYILTANHVIAGAQEIKVALASGEKEFTAKVVGADPPTDVAILKIDAKNLPAITIADSDKVDVGDVVLAIGQPFQLASTVTMGIVSAVGRTGLHIYGNQGYENFIQTDAAINPGNSGGALVDAEGRLIGINTAIYSQSGGYMGIGFAVPINLARSVMERLIKYGKVTRGYLGVGIQDVTPDLRAEFNLPDEAGALVSEVESGTPASRAGLQNGDVIRELDGKKVTDSSQLRLRIAQLAPGTKVTLKILRSPNGGKPEEKTVTVTLGEQPKEMAEGGSGQMGQNEENESTPDALSGVEVDDLTADTRQQYNIPSRVHGAVVTGVDENSNAAQAGLQEGDVIEEINRQPVRNADDAVRLSQKATGKRVLLRIWRNGGSVYISVESSKQNSGG